MGAEMIAAKTAKRGADKPRQPQGISGPLRHLDDSKIAAIIATGATLAQVEEALLWAEGESDVLGKTDHPLTGAAARVYDILTVEEAFPEVP